MKRLLLKTLTVVLLLVVATVNAHAEIISGEIQRLQWEVETETGVMTICGSGAMPNFRLNRSFISEFEYYDEETGELGEDAILIKKLIIEEGVTRLGQYAFSGALALEEVVISSSVLTSINNAFAECSTVKKITISEGIKDIKSSMFEGLTSITEVHIPTTLTSIGTSAFYDCPALKEIHIKDLDAWCNVQIGGLNALCNITSMGPDPVTGITEVKFGEPRDLILNGEKVTKFVQKNDVVNERTFAGTSIESVELHGYIRLEAFYGCSKLTSVDLSNVDVVEDAAFEYCTSLKDLKIASCCKFYCHRGYPLPYDREYGYHFRGCTSLKNIVLEEGVEVLPDIFGPLHSQNRQSYTGVYKTLEIESLTIPASLRSIDSYLRFKKACYKNESTWYASSFGNITNEVYIDGELWQAPAGDVVIPEGVTKIGNGKFSEGVTSVKIPASVTNLPTVVFQYCDSLSSIVVDSANERYDSRNNCNAVIETATNTLVAGCKNSVIPADVTSIGVEAFWSCMGLTSIEIPDGVTSIQRGAFGHCQGLTSVVIPASVTSIETEAFTDCGAITDVYVSSATPVAIDNNTFGLVISPTSTLTLYVPVGSIEAYKAAEGWKYFENIVEWTPTAIEDVQADVTAFEVTADGIQLTAAEGKAVAVYAASGALVAKINSYAGEEISLDKGVYVVRVAEKSVKVKL